MQTTISIRIDSNLKRKAQKLFKNFGLNMTSAINILLKNAVDNNALPIQSKEEIPNEETRLALAEYDEMFKNPEKYKRYDSVAEMMKDILEDA